MVVYSIPNIFPNEESNVHQIVLDRLTAAIMAVFLCASATSPRIGKQRHNKQSVLKSKV